MASNDSQERVKFPVRGSDEKDVYGISRDVEEYVFLEPCHVVADKLAGNCLQDRSP